MCQNSEVDLLEQGVSCGGQCRFWVYPRRTVGSLCARHPAAASSGDDQTSKAALCERPGGGTEQRAEALQAVSRRHCSSEGCTRVRVRRIHDLHQAERLAVHHQVSSQYRTAPARLERNRVTDGCRGAGPEPAAELAEQLRHHWAPLRGAVRRSYPTGLTFTAALRSRTATETHLGFEPSLYGF